MREASLPGAPMCATGIGVGAEIDQRTHLGLRQIDEGRPPPAMLQRLLVAGEKRFDLLFDLQHQFAEPGPPEIESAGERHCLLLTAMVLRMDAAVARTETPKLRGGLAKYQCHFGTARLLGGLQPFTGGLLARIPCRDSGRALPE